ncbi:MAG TPA: isocitrate lyase/phosphoenolpyruvate mutase family protein [Bryobacteraceae bacterium]|nr:isocitrate lyase/phosphoenolpyruvate mutase family protein [Bryobacteraceae bacterium]
MPTESQAHRAERFLAMHRGPNILVLPNAWDAASARILETAGFGAIATTSAGVAATYGYPDGERIGRAGMLEAIARIASAVSVPVTADVEAGYGTSVADVEETARGVLAAGAIGMNLEDADHHSLFDLAPQVAKVQAVRKVAEEAGIPLVINARTDVYLLKIGAPESRFDEAVRRANAYHDAGADCLFVPGVRDAETIGKLAHAIHGPINILAVSGTPSTAELQKLGVARVSVGSGPMRATLSLLRRIAEELRTRGTYTSFTDPGVISHADLNRMLEH